MEEKKQRYTNSLIHSSSPYLLQHAYNPVDWIEWSDEAFEKAKSEDKLVLVSIGYSSCHWCHVMAHESFEDEETAKIMNENFICIKIDREERPDIDQIYMDAVQIITGRGGWPLNCILLPDGKPLHGGTYFRKNEWQKILKSLADFYKDNREKAIDFTNNLTNEIKKLDAFLDETNSKISFNSIEKTIEAWKPNFDLQLGGYRWSPKFPMPNNWEMFLQFQYHADDDFIKNTVFKTLNCMADGGIFDHLGGGFARYSTDSYWKVPHFEKMLYDNAQLCEAYSRALFNNKNPLYSQALNSTCAFILREMTSPEGGFYSALDADSDGEEGKFYVWTDKELAEVLKDKSELELFKATYGSEPNFEEKFFILRRSMLPEKLALSQKTSLEKLESSLDASRKKLLALRNNRIRPFLDTKILTGWNGQMIAGLAMASKALNEPAYLKAAEKASDFILNNLQQTDGRLMRSFGAVPGEKAQAKILAYLDDYAYLVHGLLTLYEINGDKKRLTQAVELNEKMIKYHGKQGTGPFFQTSEEHEKLFARSIDQYDGAQPSANSVALSNMVKLSKYTQDPKHMKVAEDSFKGLVMRLKMQPSSSTALATALAEFLEAQPKK